jgi:hypothetical protein
MYCLSFFDVLWLFLWYLLANVLPVFLRCTSYDYSFYIFWPMYCLSFFDVLWLFLWYLLANVLPVFLRCLMTIPLVSYGQCIACVSSMSDNYSFGILWTMYCLSFFDVLWLLLWYLVTMYCLSFIDVLWLLLWYLVANVLPVFLRCLMTIPLVSCGQCIACLSSMSYDYSLGIFTRFLRR